MDAKIACSACRTVFSPGPQCCPNCGLQLTAQAIPVVKRRPPVWPYTLCAIALLILIAIMSSWRDEQRQEAAASDLLGDLRSGKLNTPQTFQARCGRAQWTELTKDGTELHYRIGANDTYVILTPKGPRFQSENVDFSYEDYEAGKKPVTYRITLDPSMAFEYLGCK